tara:strand:- start:496 stop:1203 length:708 start_codon:yes stop_codon:yes gene_type:complete
MKTLKNMILALVAMAFMTSPSYSDGADEHAGIYAGVMTSFNGLELDGKYQQATDNTTGVAGKYAQIGGLEAGWAFAMGDSFLLDFGVTMINGEAKMSSLSSGTAHANSDKAVSLSVSDLTTFYIAPTIAVTEASALYVKYGWADADMEVVGDVTKPSSIDGTTIAFGSQTQFASGIYMKTEAGVSRFDDIKMTGLGTACTSCGQDGVAGVKVPTTTSITADPTVAYGSISLGYKF